MTRALRFDLREQLRIIRRLANQSRAFELGLDTAQLQSLQRKLVLDGVLIHSIDRWIQSHQNLVPLDRLAFGDKKPLSLGARTFAILAEARWLLAWQQGDLSRCAELACRARAYSMAVTNAVETLRWDLLEARLLSRHGLTPSANALLRECLDRAAAGGFLRLLADSVPTEEWRALRETPGTLQLDKGARELLDRLALQPQAKGDLSAAAAAHARTLFGLLTWREIDILIGVAGSLSNKEIARQLHLTPETIKWHLKNILRKLNCETRMQAVERAMELGLTIT